MQVLASDGRITVMDGSREIFSTSYTDGTSIADAASVLNEFINRI